MALDIFFSNRAEILYESLKLDLFKKESSPFTRRFVVVPSPSMKNWLMLRLADDPECQIAAGLEIYYLDAALEQIYTLLDPKNHISPNELTLALLIESQIRQILQKYLSFSEAVQALWHPMMRYLKNRGDDSTRLTALSYQLARLFIQYGRYGCSMLEQWNSIKHPTNWQQHLWQCLKAASPEIEFLYQHLYTYAPKDVSVLQNVQIHLFSLSFIPARAHQFLERIAILHPVHYYLLSPCQAFWSDLCSNKERTKLHRYWKEKGASSAQLNELDLYLRAHNPLLANFGRIGREMALQIEQSVAVIDEAYALPHSVANCFSYAEHLTEEIIVDKQKEPLCLLHAVQADLTLLRLPTQAQVRPSLSPNDLSIQLHISLTRQREVEVLYNTLAHLLTFHSKDADPLTPSDIIVMLPDISVYEAAIHSVFASSKSALDFQIMETQLLMKSSLVQGYVHLLDLASGRWEAVLMLQLLEYPEFQRKQNFSLADVQQLRTWTEEAGIRWGLSSAHRQEILFRDHGPCQLIDANPAGTWEHGLGRLISTLALEPLGLRDDTSLGMHPLDTMETSQTELLTKWLALLQQLQRDLQCIANNECLSLQEWNNHLEHLLETYFSIDLKNQNDVENYSQLVNHLRAFSRCAQLCETSSYGFASIRFHLDESLQKERSCYRESHLQSIRFCSLLPMRAFPAKVIALMGMDEGAFPRQDPVLSLNALNECAKADYAPSQSDFDRYLFLEAILSARKYLLFSHVGYSYEEQREIAPSILIQELFSYLDQGYSIGEAKPSSHCTHKHPFNGFDQSYFQENTPFPSYLPQHYKLAQAHYFDEKTSPHLFLNHFARSQGPLEICSISITVQELSAFASNPLKSYFNRTLNIYLSDREEDKLQNDESFSLSALDRYQLKTKALKMETPLLFKKASERGELPSGLFKMTSLAALSTEIDAMFARLSEQKIAPEHIGSIEFSIHCDSPVCKEKGVWIVPPLICDLENGSRISITGKLKDISPKGLIIQQNQEISSLAKAWPKYLLLRHAIQRHGLPIAPQIISLKDGKVFNWVHEEECSALSDYLTYYLQGLQAPSPLIPEWIPDLLKEGAASFAQMMQKGLNDPFTPNYNPYTKWLFQHPDTVPEPVLLHKEWHPVARKLFRALQNSKKNH